MPLPVLTALAGAVVLLLCLGVLRAWPTATAVLSNPLFDTYQRLHPRPATEPPVLVVDIDEASIATLGQWPWSRSVIARMVERLQAMGAATIGFDVVFSEPDRLSLARAVEALRAQGVAIALPPTADQLDSDQVLAGALAAGNTVLGFALTDESTARPPPARAGFAYGGTDPRRYLPHFSGAVSNLDLLQTAAQGAGFFSFTTTDDNIIRTMPLAAVAGTAIYPALAIESLRAALGAKGFMLRGNDASGEGGGGAPGMTGLRVGDLDVPTEPDGRMRLYYSGMPNMTVISAARLLEADAVDRLQPVVEGRIALVGTSAIGLRDIVATPLASATPGVTVHAEIIDQIVAGGFLHEPDWSHGVLLLATLLCGVMLIAVTTRSGALASALLLAGLTSGFVAVSWHAFSAFRVIIDPVGAVATLVLLFLVLTPLRLALENREKRLVKGAFGRYLAPALVERLAREPSALRLGGETRRLTVMFSDIRGFTTLSEGMDPQSLTSLINSFLTPLTDVLLRREATIDKYIGDAIMAFWNAPLDIDRHEEKACRAALDMAKAVEVLNESRNEPIRIGIGLNSGDACVGNLGSAQRFSYSALGDSINLASRIEGLTKLYGVTIAVSDFTRQAVPALAFLEIDNVRVKGRTAPVRLHALMGDETLAGSHAFHDLAARHEAFLSLYRHGAFADASAALQGLRQTAPPQLVGLYSLYAERLSALLADPPGDGWDGVYVAKTK